MPPGAGHCGRWVICGRAGGGLPTASADPWTRDGHRWGTTPIAGLSPSAHGILSSVTAAGGDGVWATGQLSGARSDRQVVLHLVRDTWITVPASPVRSAAGAADAYPQAIAASPQGLWVAGRDRSGDHGFLTMLEGPGADGRLRQLSTPNPTPQDNYLWGIAPVGGGQHAWAVGDSVPVSTGNAASLIEYGSAAAAGRRSPARIRARPAATRSSTGSSRSARLTSGPSAPTTARAACAR